MVQIGSFDIKLIMPEIVVFLTAVSVILSDAFSRKRSGSFLNLMSIFGLVLAFGFNVVLYNSGYNTSVFSNMVIRDKLSFISNFIFIGAAFLTLLYSRDYLVRESRDYGEYYALLLFATLSMMFVASSNNLVMFFLCLEIMSVSLYALSGFIRDRALCVEAAIKYLLTGAYAAAFSVLGMGIIFYSSGNLYLMDIARAPVNALFIVGLLIFAVSIFFKLSLAPFHIWAPDVYEGSPAPVTGFMMTASKAAVFIFAIRFFVEALSGEKGLWVDVVVFISAVSMLVGNLAAIRQQNIKRLLAYSSIAHAGYALMALVSATHEALVALVFYVLAYTVMNIGAFAVISAISGEGEKLVDINDMEGMAVRKPLLAFCLSVFMFSLAGIPGTIGFMSKFYVFATAFKAGFVGLVVFALINSAIAAYYYLKVVYYIYMREPRLSFSDVKVGVATGVAIFILVVSVVKFGFLPYQLYKYIIF